MLHFYDIADTNFIEYIRISHVSIIKCVIKLPIVMMNFNFFIFESSYSL